MAITSITIENFKCIGDAVTIPIRPITLLFGKNSSGKSTVLQALHYMREVCERNNIDPDRTRMGGDIDLGDFRSKVHRHELGRKIRIRIELGLTSRDLNSLKQDLDHVTNPNSEKIEVGTGWIEVVIGWDAEEHVAYIESDCYGLNGTEWICHINKRKERQEEIPKDRFGSNGAEWSLFHKLNNHHLLYLNFKHPFIQSIEMDDLNNFSPNLFWDKTLLMLNIAIEELRGIHLGPVRDVPYRNYRAQKTPDGSLWAKGKEAWNALGRSPQLVEKTNIYMRDVLKLGYSIEILSPEKIIKIRNKEHNIDLDLSDVGFGISQVIPVLVGALHCSAQYYENRPFIKEKIFVIEEPELHLHPAIQVALCDVFIDSINTFVWEFRELKEALEDTKEKGYLGESNIDKYANIWMELLKENLDRPYLEELIKITGENSPRKIASSILRILASDEAKYKKFMNELRLNRQTLLIETHSEHLLLRLLRRVHETSSTRVDTKYKLTPNDLSVVYVQPTPEGAKFTPVSVTDDGDFDEPWPEGFFEERDSELFYHA